VNLRFWHTEFLALYDWPGNVRELEHLLSWATLKAIRAQGRENKIISIDASHLGLQQVEAMPVTTVADGDKSVLDEQGSQGLREAVDSYQRALITQILMRCNKNRAATARALKLDRSNLLRTIQRLAISSLND
jgi:anaerobic nitric oxide reductase transcription regulator